MLHPEVLALLVCPATRQDLTEATPAEVATLNEYITAGRMRTAVGKESVEPVDGALIRVDRAVAYPVRGEIPIMLVAEGLDVRGINLSQNDGVVRHA